jgi:hypothetical protein
MNAITDICENLRLGSLQTHKSLSVFPLIANASTASSMNYLMLDAALATDGFKIEEISESGTVPQLAAQNDLDQPVFLLDGDEIVGAKQNRIFNLSMMLAPRSLTQIPVSCVEAGRWNRRSSKFAASGRTQFSGGRARKMRSVSESLAMKKGASSDQHQVWDDIAQKMRRMGSESKTSAMADIFEQRAASLKSYTDALKPIHDAVGAVFAIGNRIVGMEVFDRASTYAAVAGKIIAGYALDAEEVEAEAAPSEAQVMAMVQLVMSAATVAYPVPGLGTAVRLAGAEIFGAGLVVDDRCVHLAAFAA